MKQLIGSTLLILLGMSLGMVFNASPSSKAVAETETAAANNEITAELKEIKTQLKEINSFLRTGVVKTIAVMQQ